MQNTVLTVVAIGSALVIAIVSTSGCTEEGPTTAENISGQSGYIAQATGGAQDASGGTGGALSSKGNGGASVSKAGAGSKAGSGGKAGISGKPASVAGRGGKGGQSGGTKTSDAGAGETVGGDWPTGKPEDYGLDTAVLEDAANSIQRSTGNRYGMVVIRKGVLVYEKYWEGGADDKHIIYSCTKSWGSTLIGIAVTQGLLNVKDEVRKWVPEPVSGVVAGATVEHVLSQTAQFSPPGVTFNYDMGTVLNTLPEVLEAASSMKNHDFYDKYLAKPLGISMIWPECPAGGCPGTRYHEGFIQFGNNPSNGAPLADSPSSSIRDQAKLGWLWANNGVWNGKVLINPEFIAAGSKPGAGSRATYGYLWWIQNELQYSAIGGIAECYVDIMPSRQLVIAVMGDTSMGQGGAWANFQNIVDSISD